MPPRETTDEHTAHPSRFARTAARLWALPAPVRVGASVGVALLHLSLLAACCALMLSAIAEAREAGETYPERPAAQVQQRNNDAQTVPRGRARARAASTAAGGQTTGTTTTAAPGIASLSADAGLADPTTLVIHVTCAEAGRVCVHTRPGAALDITITYCSGYQAASPSLMGMQHADADGNYTWVWSVETICHGEATVDVFGRWGVFSESAHTTFAT